MNKNLRNILLVVVIVVAIFGIIWFIYDMMKIEPADTNTVDTNLMDENTGLDNLLNGLFENVATNEQIQNEVEDDGNIVKKDETSNNTVDTSTSESITSKEERAIELVKQEWGGTDGVYFSNESIDSEGRYIVTVRNSGTTNLLAFFLVDVSTGIVTKQ